MLGDKEVWDDRLGAEKARGGRKGATLEEESPKRLDAGVLEGKLGPKGGQPA